MTVVPIGDTTRRLPQAGRIRTGEKSGAHGRRAINFFRFTTQDRDLLGPVAELYGGEINEWKDGKSGDRWELRSKANKINVVLPPNPLTEAYELWTGEKGLVRRCDGLSCSLLSPGPEGAEMIQVGCVCDEEGVLSCKYKLRLSLLLPEVPSLGVWRLDTSSDNARQEIPGVVELIMATQGAGLTNAVLRLEQRTMPGKRFNVPVLDPGVSIQALSAGAARMSAIPGSAQAHPPELGQGEGAGAESSSIGSAPPSPSMAAQAPAWSEFHDPEAILDAEVIEDVDPTIARAWLDNLPTKDKNAALRRGREISEDLGLPVPTTAAALDPRVLNQLAEEMA